MDFRRFPVFWVENRAIRPPYPLLVENSTDYIYCKTFTKWYDNIATLSTTSLLEIFQHIYLAVANIANYDNINHFLFAQSEPTFFLYRTDFRVLQLSTSYRHVTDNIELANFGIFLSAQKTPRKVYNSMSLFENNSGAEIPN